MESFANVGYGMIILGLCFIVFAVLCLFQKQHPLLNKVFGYGAVCLGITIVVIWGKGDGQLSDDPGFKAGLIISILGAAMLALGDSAKGG